MELDAKVKSVIDTLKQEHTHHIALYKKRDGYYVYETMPKWDKVKQRNTLLTLYIGKITFGGELVEPKRRKGFIKGVKNLDEYIDRLNRLENQNERSYFENEYEPLILKELSTNPRDGVAEISRRVGLPYSTTSYWIKKLEKKYEIVYTMDYWFLKQFDLNRYIVIVKFKNKRPDIDGLKRVLESNPFVQLAVSTRGTYDLFIFLIAKTPRDAEDIIYGLRSHNVLSHYPAKWYASYYGIGTGFIPLRDSFFDALKERVWHRSKEHPRKQKGQIFLREYATLKELNRNGLVKFSEIDEKYHLKNGSAQYTYHELVNNRMLLRITMYMKKPPAKGVGIFIAEQRNIGLFNEHREDYLKELILDGKEPLNRYLFEGDIGSPYGVMLITPIFSNGNLDKAEDIIRQKVKGSLVKTSVVTDVLVGNLGFRKIDTIKTWPYETLVKEYDYKTETEE